MGSIPVAGAKQKAEGAFSFCLLFGVCPDQHVSKRKASIPAQVGIFIIDINTKNASKDGAT